MTRIRTRIRSLLLAVLFVGCAMNGHAPEESSSARSAESSGAERHVAPSAGGAADAATAPSVPSGMNGGMNGGMQVDGPAPPPESMTRVRTEQAEPTLGVGGARLEYTSLVGHGSDLSSALSEGRCEDARELRDRICILSERICAIAGEHPDHGPTQDRCEDGTARCEAATARVADRC